MLTSWKAFVLSICMKVSITIHIGWIVRYGVNIFDQKMPNNVYTFILDNWTK